MAKPQQLEERIDQVRKDCDVIIDRHVAELKETCPGIPEGVLRSEVEKIAFGCKCAQAMHLISKTEELHGQ